MLEVEWSSSPLPSIVALTSDVTFQYGWLAGGAPVEGERAAEWARRAGWEESFDPAAHRIFAWCFDAGEKIVVEGCASPTDSGLIGGAPRARPPP